MQRNIDFDRIAMLVLCLSEANSTVADVLTAKARNIFTPARGKAKQVKREPRLRAKRVPFVKLLNLSVAPSVVAIRLIFKLFHPDSGVDRSFLGLVGPNKQRAKRL
jgi:hypothetical protein